MLKTEQHIYIPETLEEGVLYVSENFKVAIHLCPCGCKNQVVTPFESTGWQYQNKDGKITLSPSIGNWQIPCRSHYFIRSNEVVWA